MERTDSQNHVHFSEDTDVVEHTQISVKETSSFCYDVHVGFLQVNHSYLLTFTVPIMENVTVNVPESSVHVSVVSMKLIGNDGLRFEVSFNAYKEKLMKEKIILIKADETQLKLTLHARVLGKGKGTPMLKEGIICTGMTMEDESEHSDWQGF